MTQLMKPITDPIYAKMMKYEDKMEKARNFGSEVHRMIELYEKFNMNIEDLNIEDENIKHAFNQYLYLKELFKFEVIATEEIIAYNAKDYFNIDFDFLVAGRRDLKIKFISNNQEAICDIKTTSQFHEKPVAIQNTFYSRKENIENNYCLLLPKNGKKKGKFIKLKTYKNICSNLIEIYQFNYGKD